MNSAFGLVTHTKDRASRSRLMMLTRRSLRLFLIAGLWGVPKVQSRWKQFPASVHRPTDWIERHFSRQYCGSISTVGRRLLDRGFQNALLGSDWQLEGVGCRCDDARSCGVPAVTNCCVAAEGPGRLGGSLIDLRMICRCKTWSRVNEAAPGILIRRQCGISPDWQCEVDFIGAQTPGSGRLRESADSYLLKYATGRFLPIG